MFIIEVYWGFKIQVVNIKNLNNFVGLVVDQESLVGGVIGNLGWNIFNIIGVKQFCIWVNWCDDGNVFIIMQGYGCKVFNIWNFIGDSVLQWKVFQFYGGYNFISV